MPHAWVASLRNNAPVRFSRMPKLSAGLVLFKSTPQGMMILLGHMGGPIHASKDAGAWSIPKGAVEADEDPLAAAYRECEEELGFRPTGEAQWLGTIVQRSGKQVQVWAVEHDSDITSRSSMTYEMEWPPGSGLERSFPEMDRASWFTVDQASRLAIAGQSWLFTELERKLQDSGKG